jgi:hypothetical protein
MEDKLSINMPMSLQCPLEDHNFRGEIYLASAVWGPTASDFRRTPHRTTLHLFAIPIATYAVKWLLMMGMECLKHVEFLE